MQANGEDFVSGQAVGGGLGVSRPSVALRDEHLDYALLSLADLVIRVPMGGGTHVGKVRCASTPEVTRTSGRCGVPRHPKTRARRERARCLYIGRNTHVGVRARVGGGRWERGSPDPHATDGEDHRGRAPKFRSRFGALSSWERQSPDSLAADIERDSAFERKSGCKPMGRTLFQGEQSEACR